MISLSRNEPRCEKTGFFAYAETKTQISCAVTVQLISAFVFALRIVQSLYYLNPKFQASSHILWLYSPVCVGPGRKPRRPVFSQQASNENILDFSFEYFQFRAAVYCIDMLMRCFSFLQIYFLT